MIYLASPYSHPDPATVELRVELTMECFAALCASPEQEPVFSPILQCHETTVKYSMPSDAKFWQSYNTDFLRRSSAVYILTIEGWDISLGVTQEWELAKQLEIPVYFADVSGHVWSSTS